MKTEHCKEVMAKLGATDIFTDEQKGKPAAMKSVRGALVFVRATAFVLRRAKTHTKEVYFGGDIKPVNGVM